MPRQPTDAAPVLHTKDYHFKIPLNHAKDLSASNPAITIFCRVVSAPHHTAATPHLLYLQGGPGFASPRLEAREGWIRRALRHYRVVLLDQRGTGLSTPVLHQNLSKLPSARQQADYLKLFRADSIVRDAEVCRKRLLGGDVKWSVLGQSFGGFALLTYLSIAPEGVREAFFTGGLPPLRGPADEVYRQTYRRVIEHNQRYYQMYPEDVARVRLIVQHLGGNVVKLPGGGVLTPRRFQQLGIHFGSGGFDRIHYLLKNAFLDESNPTELSFSFLKEFESMFAFETNPLYVLLHEAIYCQGAASRWSAERVLREFPQFRWPPRGDDVRNRVDSGSAAAVYFTGEMMYSWMFEDYLYLRPLKACAELLAAHHSWPQLYDLDKLAANKVPCTAVVYATDMYVDAALSMKTAAAIGNMKVWVSRKQHHAALRGDGDYILSTLFSIRNGGAPEEGFVRGTHDPGLST